MTLPLAVVERIMRNAGADRITEEAIRVMRESADEIAEEVAVDAADIARRNGNDQVTVGAIREAMET